MFIDLYTIDDLVQLEHEYNEHVYFTIKEGNITTIKNICRINGSILISNPDFQDFGDIQEIMGSLEVSSNCTMLKSLGKITEIDGDLYLRFSSIETLSKLKFVYGNINIKDTNVSDIGDLQFVDGYIYLSKYMNSKLNLENVKVTKQIKHYSEYKSTQKEITWLSKSDKTIIPWDPGYIYSCEALNHANNSLVFPSDLFFWLCQSV